MSCLVLHRYPNELRPEKKKRTEAPRYNCAVYDSYEAWWNGFQKFLIEQGFAVGIPEKDENGKVIGEITYLPHMRCRISNLDETVLALDAESVHPRGQGAQDPHRLVRRAALRFFWQVGGGAQRMVGPAQG